MTDIEQAIARLEQALARLEAASAERLSAVAVVAEAPAGETEESGARKAVVEEIAQRVDAALARIDAVLGYRVAPQAAEEAAASLPNEAEDI